jgi:outer membrane cobalamin receptor
VRVTVVDPQGAAVAGARVSLLAAESGRVIAVQNTSPVGVAILNGEAAGARVEVLAPGFAPKTVTLSGDELRVELAVAVAPETVVTTATLSPVAAADAGAAVALLTAADLTAMQPVAANEALRFLPGAVVSTAGQRGGQASLFVRGGESRYNKVIIDGVPVNDPGGFFDFGVVPLQEVERLEFVRGPESVLYGPDAMTSVVQFWSATGRTRMPEVRFGADGGTFGTAHGYASVAGALARFDYNLFGDSFNSEGTGANDDYWNHSQGGNVGIALARRAALRLRARHSTNRSGAQNAWNFNGAALLPPDSDQRARQNNFLGSAELAINAPGAWQHRVTAYDYNHRRLNVDSVPDRGCDFARFVFRDCPFSSYADTNGAGVNYRGDYAPRDWAQNVFGYEFEDEHGDSRSLLAGGGASHGLRRNHAVYGEEVLRWRRVSLVGGVRYVHNESFGDKAVPRVAASWLALPERGFASGTRLRFSYAQGIKAPDFQEAFGNASFGILPNPNLKAEENRALEAGFQQGFAVGRVALTGTYFNNLFHNRIVFQSLGAPAFNSIFNNVDRVLAHGAELELHARLLRRLSLQSAYAYTATQVLRAPLSPSTIGQPLLRRPRHSGSLLLVGAARHAGWEFGGSFVGRRPDNDFNGFNILHAAGYARFDAGGWFALNRFATLYLNLENALDKQYNEVLGFPGLGRSVRAGVRFRIGGE